MPNFSGSCGSDDERDEFIIDFKPRGRSHNAEQGLMLSVRKESSIISDSHYSFTYKQTTGSLLSTRLTAMQRSMQTLDSSLASEALISRLLTSIAQNTALSGESRISIPLDDHVRQTDEEMLEFLTVPYLDLSPYTSLSHPQGLNDPLKRRVSNDSQLPTPPMTLSRPSARPPSMLRRASSMVLKQSEVLGKQQPSNAQPEQVGIPTPLQPNPAKQASGQAVFATTSSYPFSIKTLNDIACMVIGSTTQDAQTKSILEFVCPKMTEWLTGRILSTSTRHQKTKLSGELVELQSQLVSVWIEEPNPGILMWVIEDVPAMRLDKIGSFEPPVLAGLNRVNYNNGDVVLLGDSACWAPQAIGAAVVLDSSLTITGYNEATLRIMLGLKYSLVGRPFRQLVPQFDEFWPLVEKYAKTPGVVVPEHMFRHLAGIAYSAPAFSSPNPSRDPQNSIRAVVDVSDDDGNLRPLNTYVDLQLRIVSPTLFVIWLSYSHPAASSNVNLLPKISSVMAATPPHTPLLSPLHTPGGTARSSPSPVAASNRLEGEAAELMSITVGERRRSLKFAQFEEVKMLGRGAYGEVRLMRTPSKRHLVILKSIFKNRILVDTWSRDRVLGTIPNEIKILNQLRPSFHPNIVEMIDFFEDSENYHVEMLPFGSSRAMDLFDFIETQNAEVTPEYLLKIWQQVGSAVAHIHSLGIAHRDLKDENVIMDNHGNAKLIDFGSAAYVKQGPFDVFVGTIDYAAPEVVQGQLYEGRPQDAWALGILLYIMMFKEPPFNGADEIISGTVPEDLDCLGHNIITRLLSKGPDQRPTVPEALEIVPALE